MRHFFSTSVVFAASLLVVSASPVKAQADGQPGGMQQGQAAGGEGRRGGMGRMVQGTVTAATGDKLTVKTDAGETYSITLGDSARVMKDRQPIKLSDIKPGDTVMAMGAVDASAKTVQARMVNAIDAATVAKAKENLGKTYITGKITAIDVDNLKLTIMRQDNTSQIIQVDDGTSFQRGNRGVAAEVAAAGGMPMGGGMMGGFGGRGRQGDGQDAAPPAPESITLADIHVGDAVMATGALKNGVFTAVKMGVSAPREPGAGRRGQGQDVPAGQPPAAPPQ